MQFGSCGKQDCISYVPIAARPGAHHQWVFRPMEAAPAQLSWNSQVCQLKSSGLAGKKKRACLLWSAYFHRRMEDPSCTSPSWSMPQAQPRFRWFVAMELLTAGKSAVKLWERVCAKDYRKRTFSKRHQKLVWKNFYANFVSDFFFLVQGLVGKLRPQSTAWRSRTSPLPIACCCPALEALFIHPTVPLPAALYPKGFCQPQGKTLPVKMDGARWAPRVQELPARTSSSSLGLGQHTGLNQ